MFGKISRKSLLITAIVIFLLWLSSDLWLGLFEFTLAIWVWRPESVIGGGMILIALIMAYPAHYFLNVRHASINGTKLLSGFINSLGNRLANILVWILLNGLFFVGIIILLFGTNIT